MLNDWTIRIKLYFFRKRQLIRQHDSSSLESNVISRENIWNRLKSIKKNNQIIGTEIAENQVEMFQKLVWTYMLFIFGCYITALWFALLDVLLNLPLYFLEKHNL